MAEDKNSSPRDPRWGNPPGTQKLDPRWETPRDPGWGPLKRESSPSNDKLLKPYLVRPLTPEENSKIEQASIDPNQFELTRTLLAKQEFKPVNLLTIGKKEFLVGKPIGGKSPGFLVMFYEDPATKKLMPRLADLSLSGRSWRVTPGVYGSYSKGVGIHYTQETRAHKNISRYIEQSVANGNTVIHPSGESIDDHFTLGRRGEKTQAEWYTFDKEISRYDDKGVLKQFQQYPPGRLTEKRFGQNADLSDKFRNFDFSSPELKAFLPDFTKPPVETDVLKQTFLGETTLETYTASLNGRPVEWVMAYDKDGRVWIERIAFLDREVNSYGVMPEVIDSGCLTNKPFEYDQQIDALKFGEDYFEHTRDIGYQDITPLLDNLYPIQEFRRARNIEPERIGRSRKPITFESAKNFDELQIALARAGELKVDGKSYAPKYLAHLINELKSNEARERNLLLDMKYIPDVRGLKAAIKRLMDKSKKDAGWGLN